MICTTSEDCAEWRLERQTMPAWSLRRYGSAGLGRWLLALPHSRALTILGRTLWGDDAWCPHDSNDGVAPCAACVRVESVCPHCSPRRCLTGTVGALLWARHRETPEAPLFARAALRFSAAVVASGG